MRGFPEAFFKERLCFTWSCMDADSKINSTVQKGTAVAKTLQLPWLCWVWTLLLWVYWWGNWVFMHGLLDGRENIVIGILMDELEYVVLVQKCRGWRTNLGLPLPSTASWATNELLNLQEVATRARLVQAFGKIWCRMQTSRRKLDCGVCTSFGVLSHQGIASRLLCHHGFEEVQSCARFVTVCWVCLYLSGCT